jgi:hypothetical protein
MSILSVLQSSAEVAEFVHGRAAGGVLCDRVSNCCVPKTPAPTTNAATRICNRSIVSIGRHEGIPGRIAIATADDIDASSA